MPLSLRTLYLRLMFLCTTVDDNSSKIVEWSFTGEKGSGRRRSWWRCRYEAHRGKCEGDVETSTNSDKCKQKKKKAANENTQKIVNRKRRWEGKCTAEEDNIWGCKRIEKTISLPPGALKPPGIEFLKPSTTATNLPFLLKEGKEGPRSLFVAGKEISTGRSRCSVEEEKKSEKGT